MQNSRSHWSHRGTEAIKVAVADDDCTSRPIACCRCDRLRVREQFTYPIPAVPLPESLTTETPQPVIPVF